MDFKLRGRGLRSWVRVKVSKREWKRMSDVRAFIRIWNHHVWHIWIQIWTKDPSVLWIIAFNHSQFWITLQNGHRILKWKITVMWLLLQLIPDGVNSTPNKTILLWILRLGMRYQRITALAFVSISIGKERKKIKKLRDNTQSFPINRFDAFNCLLFDVFLSRLQEKLFSSMRSIYLDHFSHRHFFYYRNTIVYIVLHTGWNSYIFLSFFPFSFRYIIISSRPIFPSLFVCIP